MLCAAWGDELRLQHHWQSIVRCVRCPSCPCLFGGAVQRSHVCRQGLHGEEIDVLWSAAGRIYVWPVYSLHLLVLPLFLGPEIHFGPGRSCRREDEVMALPSEGRTDDREQRSGPATGPDGL